MFLQLVMSLERICKIYKISKYYLLKEISSMDQNQITYTFVRVWQAARLRPYYWDALQYSHYKQTRASALHG